jgi:hypothetical protein
MVSPETCSSSGLPHCQQKVAPLEWGAPQEGQEPAVADSYMRRMRSTSFSSASASWSSAARLTSTSTRMLLRIAIS